MQCGYVLLQPSRKFIGNGYLLFTIRVKVPDLPKCHFSLDLADKWFFAFCTYVVTYRVSHSIPWKVILLWWGHIDLIHQFLLFWCCVPSLGWYVKVKKNIFAKQSLNATNVKLLSIFFFFNSFRYFYAFFDFHLWFKVKMYIFYGLLHFITWERPLKVKIALNLLWNMRSWLIDP